MRPIDAHTGRSIAISSAVMQPALMCGRSPVRSRTAAAACCEIMKGALEPVRGQPLARGAVAQFRAFAQGEQRLLAAQIRPLGRGRDHLLDGQVGALEPPRRLRKGAVVTGVAAQLRERQKHLRRVADQRAEPRVPQRARARRELGRARRRQRVRTHRRERPALADEAVAVEGTVARSNDANGPGSSCSPTLARKVSRSSGVSMSNDTAGSQSSCASAPAARRCLEKLSGPNDG